MHNITICIFTTAHPTDDIRVYDKFCVTFLQRGYNVKWIGPDHIFFSKVENRDKEVSWELFKNKGGLKGRINNIKNAYHALKELKNVDYIYCPDPDAAFLAVNFKPSKSIKVIFDIHEVYHKDLLKRRTMGFEMNFISNIIKKIISNVCEKADLVIAVSNKVLSYYVFDDKKSYIVRSCAPISIIDDINRQVIQKNENFTIVHGKNHISRGTGVVIEAINILKGKYSAGDFKVLMIDLYGALEASRDNPYSVQVNKYGVEEFIDLRSGMPLREMQIELSKSNGGLISYGRELGVDSLPNRLFEFMANGLPVIVPEYADEIVNIVKKENCGIITNMENAVKIAEAMEYLIENKEEAYKMGANGKEAFYKRHNWENEIAPIVNFMN
jgi:glycosyltransferase involved in cell wall biosynthesis